MSNSSCDSSLVVLFSVGAAVLGTVIRWVLRQEAKDRAREAYREALAELANNPTDHALKTKAMKLGDAYSEATRLPRKPPTFSQIDLLQDIERVTQQKSPVMFEREAPVPGITQSRLDELEQLLLSGQISDEEYELHRTRILYEI